MVDLLVLTQAFCILTGINKIMNAHPIYIYIILLHFQDVHDVNLNECPPTIHTKITKYESAAEEIVLFM